MTNLEVEQARIDDAVAKAAKMGVRHLKGAEELSMMQTRMLAAFARAGVPKPLWQDLQACRGSGCPNEVCSAACHFGERHQLLDLIKPARKLLLASELPLHFGTIVDPRNYRAAGKLSELSLNAMQQWLKRRVSSFEAEYGPALMIGGIEASFESDNDGNRYWGPHIHFAIGSECPRREMREKLRPSGHLPKNYKPVVFKDITDLANCISYCTKRAPAERVSRVGSRGTQDRYKHAVDGPAQLEHDLWLLSQKATDRLLLRGVKRVHGKLVQLKR